MNFYLYFNLKVLKKYFGKELKILFPNKKKKLINQLKI